MSEGKNLEKKVDQAEKLLESGKVSNTVVEDGVVKVKNEISGNWEPWHGQETQKA